MTERIRFWLDGCDIAFVAEAPADITLKQLLEQCDKIRPDWCACGIRSIDAGEDSTIAISIDYNSIRKVDKHAPCTIREGAMERESAGQ